MHTDDRDHEIRKQAIFDAMSQRGRQRILKIGYENWDPFQEPKDPRERIFSSSSLQAGTLLREFLQLRPNEEPSPALFKELFELCKGFIDGEARARLIFDFCDWYRERSALHLE